MAQRRTYRPDERGPCQGRSRFRSAAPPFSSPDPRIRPGTNTSFGPLKQIDAGLLNVGYVEAGPADGPAVILLHGWPYDIHSYVDVTPLLASAGYRVIVPYLRGYGTTHFLSRETFRNGQQSAVALDIINLMDALKIEKATIAGFDWGARTADIMAALWPERCRAIVSVGGYLIGTPESNKKPVLSSSMTRLLWLLLSHRDRRNRPGPTPLESLCVVVYRARPGQLNDKESVTWQTGSNLRSSA